MTRPARTPSPLAHGPGDLCATCGDCPSCAGGTRAVPAQYQPVIDGDGAAHALCTVCGGCGTTCLNLVASA